MTQPPLLELEAVAKRFGGVVALDNVDFALQAGEVHGLIGENGAGKSTLMKLLAGVYSDYGGEMRLDGEVVCFGSPAEAQARGIGMVYQELSTFKHLTVAENIFSRNPPLRRGLVSWRRMNQEGQAYLNELGLDIDVTHNMGQLPIGNQQIVEIARVIFSGARIVIMDEPTSALSLPETQRLFEFIATLKSQGKTVIFISHFLEDVLQVTDRITVLKNGRNVATVQSNKSNKHELVSLMIGTEAKILQKIYEEESGLVNRQREAVGEVVLTLKGVSKRGIFENVSLTVHRGEIVGLFGFMGAGQIFLARCLFGAERFDEGAMMVNGRSLTLKNTTQAKAAGIAYVPENRHDSLMLSQEIYKNITLAYLGSLVRGWLNQKTEVAIAATQIAQLGIRPSQPLLPVGALSGGNQQKVVLAKWLTQRPSLLILNEPTRGIDVAAKDEVITIIRRLRDEGVAILLISTEPETILSNADRVLVMSKGHIAAAISAGELTKENLMKHA